MVKTTRFWHNWAKRGVYRVFFAARCFWGLDPERYHLLYFYDCIRPQMQTYSILHQISTPSFIRVPGFWHGVIHRNSIPLFIFGAQLNCVKLLDVASTISNHSFCGILFSFLFERRENNNLDSYPLSVFCPSVCLVCLSVSVYPCVCLSVCLSISMSVCLSVRVSVYQCVCLSVYQCVCLSAYLSISISFFSPGDSVTSPLLYSLCHSS